MELNQKKLVNDIEKIIKDLSDLEFEFNLLDMTGNMSSDLKQSYGYLKEQFDGMQIMLAESLENFQNKQYERDVLLTAFTSSIALKKLIDIFRTSVDAENKKAYNIEATPDNEG